MEEQFIVRENITSCKQHKMKPCLVYTGTTTKCAITRALRLDKENRQPDHSVLGFDVRDSAFWSTHMYEVL